MAPDLLSLLRGIDLRTPWFAPWAPWIAPVVQQVLSGRSVAEALNRTQDDLGLQSVVPVRFVAQAELPAGEAYEAYIARTQTVPTRDHVHDLLNGVCWLRFPATKRRLNHWQGEHIAVSAKTGQGLEALRAKLLAIAGWQSTSEGVFIARERHLQALRRTLEHVDLADEHAHSPMPALELLAEELRLAHDALGEITGAFTADDLLGEIFSRFCIGK